MPETITVYEQIGRLRRVEIIIEPRHAFVIQTEGSLGEFLSTLLSVIFSMADNGHISYCDMFQVVKEITRDRENILDILNYYRGSRRKVAK